LAYKFKKSFDEGTSQLYELLQEEEYQSMNAGSSKKRKIQVEISAEEVINTCVDLMTTERRPFALLDCKPFRILIEPIFAGKKIHMSMYLFIFVIHILFGKFLGLKMNVINSHNVLNIIDERYQALRQQIKQICARKLISLKIDAATRCGRSIFGVNMQYIDIVTMRRLPASFARNTGYRPPMPD